LKTADFYQLVVFLSGMFVRINCYAKHHHPSFHLASLCVVDFSCFPFFSGGKVCITYVATDIPKKTRQDPKLPVPYWERSNLNLPWKQKAAKLLVDSKVLVCWWIWMIIF